MAHYAFLNEKNIVTHVIAGNDEETGDWEAYYANLTGQRCVRTSYNTSAGAHRNGGTPLRKNYAGIGYTYDENRDAFIPPRPEPTEEVSEWILNEDTCLWEPVSEV